MFVFLQAQSNWSDFFILFFFSLFIWRVVWVRNSNRVLSSFSPRARVTHCASLFSLSLSLSLSPPFLFLKGKASSNQINVCRSTLRYAVDPLYMALPGAALLPLLLPLETMMALKDDPLLRYNLVQSSWWFVFFFIFHFSGLFCLKRGKKKI